MEFKFDSKKTTQAAAILLSLKRGVMDRMRLLKLLYLADRELLLDRGRTLTGDRAVAMNYGPVLSHTYNLVKGTEQSPEDWDKCIRSVGKRLVILVGDPGRGELSEREVTKLEELTRRYRHLSTMGLSGLTHEFKEWIEKFVPDTSTRIDWSDALRAAGGANKVEEYEARLKEQEILDSVFSAPSEEEAEVGVL